MQTATRAQLSPLVSSRAYASILTSRRLSRMLLPEGLSSSPYEILDYKATLTLEDPKGMRATFRRAETVRFLQNGVSGILDHYWGDGVPLTFYDNEAGHLEDSFKDEGRHHLVIGLKRAMGRGEIMSFKVVRTALVEFIKDEGRLETNLDHPARQLTRAIVFPRERPCRQATLHCEGRQLPLPVRKLANGRTIVRFQVLAPGVDSAYTIRWSW